MLWFTKWHFMDNFTASCINTTPHFFHNKFDTALSYVCHGGNQQWWTSVNYDSRKIPEQCFQLPVWQVRHIRRVGCGHYISPGYIWYSKDWPVSRFESYWMITSLIIIHDWISLQHRIWLREFWWKSILRCFIFWSLSLW